MFRLAHLSDIHLTPLPPVRWHELISKRITGYLNWKINRTSVMQEGVLEGLVAHLKSHNPDHIAVTGDLVNLALGSEIANARDWLETLGAPEDVSLVPGNHDAYVPGALKQALHAWNSYLCSDSGDQAFPYRRDRGPVSIIGLNSGIATAPFMATGKFDPRQASAARQMLDQAGKEGRFRVVLIHHPPFPNATSWMKRLIGQARFRQMIRETGAELVLHGHTHIDSFQWIDGPQQPVAVVGVPSASASPNSSPAPVHAKPAARYNLFSIEGESGNWTCTMQEHGYSATAEGVHQIAKRDIIANGVAIKGLEDHL